MALTIRQATAPDGRKFIHFQEDAGKMEIVVSRETVEWALKSFDSEDPVLHEIDKRKR